MSLSTDRVRTHTAHAVLSSIDDQTVRSVTDLAHGEAGLIARRLDQLDAEWDSDRMVEAEAAATGLAGLALGVAVAPAFLAVTGVVAGAVLMHATTGRYPLMPLFRRLGVRTAREIARERYALKALRGDFVALGKNVDAAMTATAPSAASDPAQVSPPMGK